MNILKLPRYDTKFGANEVARILSVDRNLVKTWAYHFSKYLGPLAHPLEKGTRRQFSVDDLRVLAYVSMYWEDQPDFESIRTGLNSDSHFEKSCEGLLTSVKPLFQEPPDDLDENWRHGALIGGGSKIDFFDLAESYKLAGDMLVDAALSNDEALELIYPVVYNYRHATELYLKATVAPARDDSKNINHNLGVLLQRFRELVRTEFTATLPEWFENIILVLNDSDPDSSTFRYGDGSFLARGEVWVDLSHMKTQVGWLADSCQEIRRRRRTM